MKHFNAHPQLTFLYSCAFLFLGMSGPALAQVSLVKSVNASSASPGNPITYTLNYSNPAVTVTCADTFEADTLGAFPAGWTQSTGTWTTIADNGIAVAGTKAVQGVAAANAFPKILNSCAGQIGDGYIQTDMKIGAGGVQQGVLLWRYAGTNVPTVTNGSNYQVVVAVGNTNNIILGYYDNGAGTFNQIQASSFAIAAGTWYTVKLETTGAASVTLTLSINGTVIAGPVVSAFAVPSGQGGLQSNNGSTVAFDNVQIVKYPQAYNVTE